MKDDETELRKAIIQLSKIAGMSYEGDMKLGTTATGYMNAWHELQRRKYVESLKEENDKLLAFIEGLQVTIEGQQKMINSFKGLA